jgi:hypothetical protein
VSVCILNSIQTILTLSFSMLSWLSALLATMAPAIQALKVVPDGGVEKLVTRGRANRATPVR